MILSKFRRTAFDQELVYATKLMFSDEKYIRNPPTLQEIKQRISVVSSNKSKQSKATDNPVTPYRPGASPATPQAPWKPSQQPGQSSGYNSNLAQALHNRLNKTPNSSGCWKCGDPDHYSANCPNGRVKKTNAEEPEEPPELEEDSDGDYSMLVDLEGRIKKFCTACNSKGHHKHECTKKPAKPFEKWNQQNRQSTSAQEKTTSPAAVKVTHSEMSECNPGLKELVADILHASLYKVHQLGLKAPHTPTSTNSATVQPQQASPVAQTSSSSSIINSTSPEAECAASAPNCSHSQVSN